MAKVKQSDEFEAGRQAYEKSDYSKAVLELQTAAAKETQNGEIQLLLTKSYLELQERDAAITSAEKSGGDRSEEFGVSRMAGESVRGESGP